MIALPLMNDCCAYRLTRGRDKFVIIASDGVWDALTNEEAVRFVQTVLNSLLPGEEGDDLYEGADRGAAGGSSSSSGGVVSNGSSGDSATSLAYAADKLVEEAFARGSVDNLSAIIIKLNEHQEISDDTSSQVAPAKETTSWLNGLKRNLLPAFVES